MQPQISSANPQRMRKRTDQQAAVAILAYADERASPGGDFRFCAGFLDVGNNEGRGTVS